MGAGTTERDAAERIRVTTQGMAYGPHAVARHDGKVLFVRGAAPNEDVEVVVREQRRRFAYAETLRVVRSSPVRRPAPCPYLPRCGGCPWQHIEYAAQLSAKRAIVTEQLRRIAGIDVVAAPATPSSREFGYRRRLKLRVHDGMVGFHAAASHALVPVCHCLLAEPSVDATISAAAALAQSLRPRIRRIEVVGRGNDEAGVVVVAEAEGAWEPRDAARCRRWLAAHHDVYGLRLSGRGWQQTWGDTRVTVTPELGVALTARAQTFTQVNPETNRLLVETVVRFIGPGPTSRVLDLYAGAGNLSLPLARHGARVLAVEQHRQAAEDGLTNARSVAGRYEVRVAPAEHVLATLSATGARFDVAVLDPPRSGAAAALAPLMRLAPPRIVYVSCDPATLSRDLRVLGQQYRVSMVQPIDMFPQTYHIETVVCAELACESAGRGVSSVGRREAAQPRRPRLGEGVAAPRRWV